MDDEFLLYLWGGSGAPIIQLASGNSLQAFIGSTPISGDQTWHHVAVTRSGANVTIYVDGMVDGSGVFAAPLNATSQPYLIGAYRNNLGQVVGSFHGSIDEVRLWNVARTQALLQANMQTILVGPQPGLIGYWRLDDGAGSPANQVVSDLSIASVNGTLGTGVTSGLDDPLWSTTDVAPLSYPGISGQSNSPTARLEINGVGAGTQPGPFVVCTAPLQPLTFAWQGAPLMPIILVTGPMNPTPFTLPGFGTIHLGTPPLFNDVLVVFDGAHMSGGLQLTTSPTGTAAQTVIVPAGTPPGTQIAVQGIVEQVAGTTTYGNLLTAAFRIDVS